MPPSYFPLRWESTGDQWWYASPIDWAAANGHYDLVRELVHLDANLLIKLTSLRRIRRLETVWDDEAQFEGVANCRSHVAQKLLLECETKKGNSLIRAGYGGWLMYTAASAGDVEFVQELLKRDPLLVFGEGEYGVTDIFYAAARSKRSEVFRLLFDFSVSPRCVLSGGELEEQPREIPSVFRWEMLNRAIHAAARGGNLEILKELLGDSSDVLVYRDAQRSTVLHAAAGRGQAEVVEDLVAAFDIITSTDSQGNTALHVAAYRGHLAVVERLITSSPSSVTITNNVGDTFLHTAVAGFRTSGFRRLDRQIELMKQLLCGNIVNMEMVVNIRNNDGRTALHMAVIGNIHSNLVELLMNVPSIDLNIRDVDGMTPLDVLRQWPRSASSEILIKQIISAGGISNGEDYMARSAIASHLKMQGTGVSPGTSFRIPDSEIFLYTGIETSDTYGDRGSGRLSTYSSETSHESVNSKYVSCDNKKESPMKNAARRLKILLGWPGRKEKKLIDTRKPEDGDSVGSYKMWSDREETPTPLRQRFSKSSLPNNKRTLAVRSNAPSPSTKKRFASGLMHGVIQSKPHASAHNRSRTSSFSVSTMSSPISMDKLKGVLTVDDNAGPSCSYQSYDAESQDMVNKSTSVNKRLMNQYFCFGAQALRLDDMSCGSAINQEYQQSVLPVA